MSHGITILSSQLCPTGFFYPPSGEAVIIMKMNGTSELKGPYSNTKRTLGAPSQCARRGRVEDAAAGTLELIQMLRNMDEDVLQRMVQAREAATNIHKAFPGGDQRFINQDDDVYDDDDEENDACEGNISAGDHETSEEEDDRGDVCVGLFDNIVDSGPHASLQRVKDTYNFDLVAEMDNAKLDLLERIRIVNWIRKLVRDDCHTPENVLAHTREIFGSCGDNMEILKDDSLLVPVVPGDVLLTVLENHAGTTSLTESDVQNDATGFTNGNGEDDEDDVRIAVLQTIRNVNI